MQKKLSVRGIPGSENCVRGAISPSILIASQETIKLLLAVAREPAQNMQFKYSTT